MVHWVGFPLPCLITGKIPRSAAPDAAPRHVPWSKGHGARPDRGALALKKKDRKGYPLVMTNIAIENGHL